MFISFAAGIVKHGAHSSRPKRIAICNSYATRCEFLVSGTCIGNLFWLLNHCQWVLKNAWIYQLFEAFLLMFLLNTDRLEFCEWSYTVTESEIKCLNPTTIMGLSFWLLMCRNVDLIAFVPTFVCKNFQKNCYHKKTYVLAFISQQNISGKQSLRYQFFWLFNSQTRWRGSKCWLTAHWLTNQAKTVTH